MITRVACAPVTIDRFSRRRAGARRRHRGAVAVQRVGRGWHARRRAAVRRARHTAAVRVQSVVRMWLARRVTARRRLAWLLWRVLYLQRTRENTKLLRALRTIAATRLQAWTRMWIRRRRFATLLFMTTQAAATRVQVHLARLHRGAVARRFARRWRARRTAVRSRAALMTFDSFRTARSGAQHAATLSSMYLAAARRRQLAAVDVQRVWRGVVGRRVAGRRRAAMRVARRVARVQAIFRRWKAAQLRADLARDRALRDVERRWAAALLVQRVARGWLFGRVVARHARRAVAQDEAHQVALEAARQDALRPASRLSRARALWRRGVRRLRKQMRLVPFDELSEGSSPEEDESPPDAVRAVRGGRQRQTAGAHGGGGGGGATGATGAAGADDGTAGGGGDDFDNESVDMVVTHDGVLDTTTEEGRALLERRLAGSGKAARDLQSNMFTLAAGGWYCPSCACFNAVHDMKVPGAAPRFGTTCSRCKRPRQAPHQHARHPQRSPSGAPLLPATPDRPLVEVLSPREKLLRRYGLSDRDSPHATPRPMQVTVSAAAAAVAGFEGHGGDATDVIRGFVEPVRGPSPPPGAAAAAIRAELTGQAFDVSHRPSHGESHRPSRRRQARQRAGPPAQRRAHGVDTHGGSAPGAGDVGGAGRQGRRTSDPVQRRLTFDEGAGEGSLVRSDTPQDVDVDSGSDDEAVSLPVRVRGRRRDGEGRGASRVRYEGGAMDDGVTEFPRSARRSDRDSDGVTEFPRSAGRSDSEFDGVTEFPRSARRDGSQADGLTEFPTSARPDENGAQNDGLTEFPTSARREGDGLTEFPTSARREGDGLTEFPTSARSGSEQDDGMTELPTSARRDDGDSGGDDDGVTELPFSARRSGGADTDGKTEFPNSVVDDGGDGDGTDGKTEFPHSVLGDGGGGDGSDGVTEFPSSVVGGGGGGDVTDGVTEFPSSVVGDGGGGDVTDDGVTEFPNSVRGEDGQADGKDDAMTEFPPSVRLDDSRSDGKDDDGVTEFPASARRDVSQDGEVDDGVTEYPTSARRDDGQYGSLGDDTDGVTEFPASVADNGERGSDADGMTEFPASVGGDDVDVDVDDGVTEFPTSARRDDGKHDDDEHVDDGVTEYPSSARDHIPGPGDGEPNGATPARHSTQPRPDRKDILRKPDRQARRDKPKKVVRFFLPPPAAGGVTERWMDTSDNETGDTGRSADGQTLTSPALRRLRVQHGVPSSSMSVDSMSDDERPSVFARSTGSGDVRNVATVHVHGAQSERADPSSDHGSMSRRDGGAEVAAASQSGPSDQSSVKGGINPVDTATAEAKHAPSSSSSPSRARVWKTAVDDGSGDAYYFVEDQPDVASRWTLPHPHAHPDDLWECHNCTLHNRLALPECGACGTLRPYCDGDSQQVQGGGGSAAAAVEATEPTDKPTHPQHATPASGAGRNVGAGAESGEVPRPSFATGEIPQRVSGGWNALDSGLTEASGFVDEDGAPSTTGAPSAHMPPHAASRSGSNRSNSDAPSEGASESPNGARQEWPCPTCTYLNSPDAEECDMCDTPRPASGHTGAPSPRHGAAADDDDGEGQTEWGNDTTASWTGTSLSTQHPVAQAPGEVGAQPGLHASSAASLGSAVARGGAPQSWECELCTLKNPYGTGTTVCAACGGFAPQSAVAPVFTFGDGSGANGSVPQEWSADAYEDNLPYR